MNSAGKLFRVLFFNKPSVSSCALKFHLSADLKQRRLPGNYISNPYIESPLWFTNLPGRKRRARALLDKKRGKAINPISLGDVVISCKNKKLNHYKGHTYGKFDVIPLASKGWHNKKSAGDYFTILPISEHPAFLHHSSETVPCTFKEVGLSDEIQEKLNEMGISHPTTIQAKGIEKVLQGENVLLNAETGSGKTLAYLAPIVQNIKALKKQCPPTNNAPLAIILTPTRELAVQIGMVANKLCSDLGINCLTLLGGQTKKLLLNPVIEEVDILVCTLGVIKKMLTHQLYTFEMCKFVVLDEADTLLDDSFSYDLKRFLFKAKLRFLEPGSTERSGNCAQICFVSATKPTSLDSTFGEVIPKKCLHEISTSYLHKIQPHIPQHFLRVKKSEKPHHLLKLVKKNLSQNRPTIIFSNKTATCKWVDYFLNESRVNCIAIHAQMKAENRLELYQSFREGLVDVISCTDIASRGLDCTRAKHVINYEFPRFMADYIHRCGRTGRIGHVKNCEITNFVSSVAELHLVHEIEKAVRTQSVLPQVNNNITRIIHYKAQKKIMEIEN